MSEEDISNMKDPWLLDKSFNGLSDEIFDDVIKFFDFPLEDVEANLAEEEDWDTQFKRIEEPAFDVFSVSSSDLCGKTQNHNPKLGRSFAASCNEASPIIQGAKPAKPNVLSSNKKDLPWFQTYSPVSVFESSSSSSSENPNFDLPVIPVKRPRGRRQRLSSFSPLLSIPFISSTTSPHFQKPQRNSVSESDFERQVNLNNKVKRKPRRKDLSILSSDNTNVEKSSCEDSARKCMHCEVTKTPQWREGPMGPKTLCNACGVRYRSGRLFPEYRPAASPTFVPSMHSNSHKKVVEMRNKGNLGGTSIMGFAANSLG